mgnify:CR=1 FL=1
MNKAFPKTNNLSQFKLHLNGILRHELNYQIISKNYEYDQGMNL